MRGDDWRSWNFGWINSRSGLKKKEKQQPVLILADFFLCSISRGCQGEWNIALALQYREPQARLAFAAKCSIYIYIRAAHKKRARERACALALLNSITPRLYSDLPFNEHRTIAESHKALKICIARCACPLFIIRSFLFNWFAFIGVREVDAKTR